MDVTFCGHSRVFDQDRVSVWLDQILPSLIEGGATTFYLGGRGEFDSLAASAVRRQKTAYPHVEAILVLAYMDRRVDTSRYDGVTYPPLEKVPPRYAIRKRNEWMVCQSDVVISGVIHDWGGAFKMLGHAKGKKKVILQYPQKRMECSDPAVLEAEG